MKFTDIIGAQIHHCQSRRNHRTFHVIRNEERDKGPTLLMLTSGMAYFEFTDGRIRAGKDDILCWDAGELKETHPVPGRAPSYTVVVFDLLSSSGGKLRFSDIGVPHLIKVHSPKSIRLLLNKIERGFETRVGNRLLNCSILGLTLLNTIEKKMVSEKTGDQDAADTLHYRIRESLSYIAENHKKPLGVDLLAKRACLNPAYFSRLFKQQVGMPPNRYILEYKIGKAKDFLRVYDEPLAFTGEELGFHDYSHFYRTFKKIAGMTPREFVRKSRRSYDPRQNPWYA